MTTEKTPHKHADILRAIADGTTVQYREDASDKWKDRADDSNAPDPITHYYCKHFNESAASIKLTFDGETGKLKSAEVI